MTSHRVFLTTVVCLTTAAVSPVFSQESHVNRMSSPSRTVRKGDTTAPADSARVVANGRYGASRFHRQMLGDGWRDLWGTPIVVPVLNLDQFAGGLEAKEIGGGHQTRSLRLKSKDGRSWTFRPLFKSKLDNVAQWDGTVVMDILRDGLSANFPAAPVVSPPFLQAVGVLHPTPRLYVLPNDERLGEWRKEFAGSLGTIEEHLDDVEAGSEETGFAGAIEVIDSEKLLKSINKDAKRRVDQRKYLRARLVDMFLNDNDRHEDQWKWARMHARDSLWEPIPRDRDRVFISYGGTLVRLASHFKNNLIPFDSSYASPTDAAGSELDLDGRLLDALDRKDWEREIDFVSHAMTDSVIDTALALLPAGYRRAVPRLAGSLRARRGELRDVALRYYAVLARVVNLHATDDAERAEIVRDAEGGLTVSFRAPNDEVWYHRRFAPTETQALRVYLHGGDDSAVVRGAGALRIELRVIGGNGTNVLADSETESRASHATHLYDLGTIDGVKYEPDSGFNRRPWFKAYGRLIPPNKDVGTAMSPLFTMHTGRGLGFVPGIGIARTHYGFRRAPYEYRLSLLTEYSTKVGRTRTMAGADFRFENSTRLIKLESGMSDLDLVRFAGFGNSLAYRDVPETNIRNRQWTARVAGGIAFGPNSELSLGPIVKYVTTDSVPGQMIAQLHPTGFPTFRQAGAELRFNFDTRNATTNPSRGFLVRASAAAYPSIWDVSAPFEHVKGSVSAYLPVAARKGSVLAMRVGGEKLFGNYPFFEAAFLGGAGTLRVPRYQQYVGDAAVFGATELRVPVARFSFILPLDLGLIAGGESGRVFLQSQPGGEWHSAASAGFWLGVLGPTLGINVLVTTDRERTFLLGTGVNF